MTTTSSILEELALKIVDLTGYGGKLHVNDIKPDIRTAFTKYNSELVEKVEDMKGFILYKSTEKGEEECVVVSKDQVLDLLKEEGSTYPPLPPIK